ncbi:polysaccharide pyruvyl transferase CsaB [Roseibium album]|nr:polysaccharide pyruvyl transferase CsaB [Roseibium album]
MKIVLFDDILERHVRRSLARALRARGHEVFETDPVWQGHKFPVTREDRSNVFEVVESVAQQKPDALLNFRAASLTPDMLDYLRSKKIFTFVWLPDDPVLYSVCYGSTVEYYDFVLNCGDRCVLDFYAKRHDVFGVNFPFWTDNTEFPRARLQQATTKFDVAFLGNLRGAVRNKRYDILASLPGEVRIYGRVDEDPANIAMGYLDSEADIAATLGQARLGFNIPQIFSDYHGHQYDFDGLARLGSFEFPSRVIQYAAVGLPVVTFGQVQAPATFPEMLASTEIGDIANIVRELLADNDMCSDLSRATYSRFQSSFSADSRAGFIEAILNDPHTFRQVPSKQRACLFADHAYLDDLTKATSLSQTPEEECPSLEQQIETLVGEQLESPRKYRIVCIGRAGLQGQRAGVFAGHVRALKNLGHAVCHLQGADFDRILKVAKGFRASILMVEGRGAGVTAEEVEKLKAAGLLLVTLTPDDPVGFESNRNYARHFDFHFTGSCLAHERYLENGFKRTFLLPSGIDLGWILTRPFDPDQPGPDIVCIEDRASSSQKAVMQAVRDAYRSVGLYGEDWGEGGANPDDALLSEAERQKIRRAGLINVCFPDDNDQADSMPQGVVEAIAAGAICIMGQRNVVENDDRPEPGIGKFKDTTDLIAEIRDLLANPAERDRRRRRAFRKLVDHHLRERQWRDALCRIESCLSPSNDILSDERRPLINETLEPSSEREVRALLTGYYGHANLGDELILESVIQAVTRHRPEVSLVVATTAPKAVTESRGIEAVGLGDLEKLSAIAANVDAAILGGGGLWHDYSFRDAGGVKALYDASSRSIGGYSRPSLMAAGLGAPVHVYGMGVGPLSDPDAKSFLNQIATQMTTISVRDQSSADLLRAIDNWRQPVRVVPDMVYALDLPVCGSVPEIDEVAGDLPVVVVNLRSWPYQDLGRTIERLTGALSATFKLSPFALVGFPMQEAGKSDEVQIRRLFDRLPDEIPRLIVRWNGDASKAINTINRADAVFAMRLHTCLLAHRLEKPVIGFSYDPKVRAHFEELCREDSVMDFATLPGTWKEKLVKLISGQTLISSETKSRIVELERRSREELHRLVRDLPSAMPRRKITMLLEEKSSDVRPPANPHPTGGGSKISTASAEETIDETLTNWAYSDSGKGRQIANWWNYGKLPKKAQQCLREDGRLALSVDAEGALNARVAFAEGDKFYFTTGTETLKVPSSVALRWPLRPRREYQLKVSFEALSGNPEVRYWIIEYDQHSRLQHSTATLKPGHNFLKLSSGPEARSFRVAFRLAGHGECKIHPFRLTSRARRQGA